MNSHKLLLQVMRQVLDEIGVEEVPAAGEFSLPEQRPVLFPGAVYGFATRLSFDERQRLFDEAQGRRLSRLASIAAFQPIGDDLYPLYWGKDKQLGARPHQHLQDPVKTGAIRLSTYEALRGKTLAVVSLTVADFTSAEEAMQRRYPDLLKTTTKKFAT